MQPNQIDIERWTDIKQMFQSAHPEQHFQNEL